MEPSPQRRCPHCGMPVAQRAETCLMCGALLKERQTRKFRIPAADFYLPLLLVVAVAAAWIWKPWNARANQREAAITATPTSTATPTPTPSSPVAPTATPLDTAIPSPTPTLLPNQTIHVVASGETVSTIAERYGTTTNAILRANNLKATSIIKPGNKLIIPLPVALVPTTTRTPVPSPTPLTYMIKSGDTLSTIAEKFNTTSALLMAANGITDPTRIHPGGLLRIVRPGDVTPTPTESPTKEYTVKSGDTLVDIAAKYKVSLTDLKKANGLKSDLLHIGQKLIIPGGPAGSAPAPTATPSATPGPTATSVATAAMAMSASSTLSMTEASTGTMTAPLLGAMAEPSPQLDGQAADLLAPADDAVFEGPNAVILLNWASVGILDRDEWYVIRLRRTTADDKEIGLYWTQATSLRVPARLYVPGGSEAERWRWRVMVMRHTGADENGEWVGVEIRPASATRTFYWK